MAQSKLKTLIIAPSAWSEKNLKIKPEDLSRFVPYGNGVYGYQRNSFEPIRGSPTMEERGGFIYFGNDIKREDFESFLKKIMNVNLAMKDYAAFVQESSNPIEDRYFTQMRLVSRFGLLFMFEAINDQEYEGFGEQKLTLSEILWGFMKKEKKRFGTFFGDPKIEGKMGGDGYMAREQLSFGFMLENEYSQVYRIWSRAWLVTK